MTHEGERSGEPTSYGLQPPGAAEVPAPRSEGGAQSDVGSLVGGRYRLLARLGHGGMGTVWRAHDEVVDREVAVKEPRVPEHLSHRERETMYQRMRREARAAARIDHPSVVTIHDVVVEEERPWIVMELVRGHSLADVLQEGTLDAREAARIGGAVAGALDAAHAKGILHRDVKPDNVLLGDHQRVVLTDFGIAQVEGEQRLTETGAFVGSPEYIAPERVLGQRPGPGSDLWSLGVVLYAATEGVSPFRRANTPATLQAVLSAEPQRPAQAAAVSGALGMLVVNLLQKEPAMRPGAAEVRQTLDDVARPTPQLPQQTTEPRTAAFTRALRAYPGKVRSSRRWQWGTGGAVAALAAVAALVVFLAVDRAPSGWSTREEDERVRATLAVPDGYERSAGENSVTYTEPGGLIEIYLSRYTKNVEEDALAEANAFKSRYDDGDPDDYTTTKEDVRSAVSETEHQDREAASVTTRYTDATAEEETPEALTERRAQELFYVNEDGVAWRLKVDMPQKGSAMEEGLDVYAQAVESLEIHEP
ncbi:serine/threonine-protein kinase [Streptomyces sulphureus]|uniref:serine/threonine-protein kinase n=1 Tax=Streptomyces sulphureus TaxID=47758 RepID=UPI00035CE619|nr:serine/threonine-protein kinase [Streptomyces sulphureus]